jgi:HEAT repeat protein
MMESAELDRGCVLRTLYQVLERDNSLSRCCAVKALERVDGREDASRKRLMDLLLDPDPDVRTDVAATLGRMGMAEATDALLYNLENDPDGEVRIEAVKALSGIGSRAAVEPLIRCLEADGYPDLDDGDMADEMTYAACWEVHSQTLEALGKLGDARATESVIALLEDGEYADLQEIGYRVLAELSSDQAREFLLARALVVLPRLEGESRDLSSELVNGLTSALMDPDPGVRIYAAQALAGCSNPLVVVPLTMLLADPETEVRREVASLLGRMRGQRIVDRLHQLLTDPDPGVRRQIVQVLGEIGDPASSAFLSPLLNSDDEDLLHEVVGAMGKIGLAGSEAAIAAILANENAHFTVRIQAAKALGHLLEEATSVQDPTLDPRSILARSVFDEHDAVSQAALTALVDMDAQNAGATLEALVRGEFPFATRDPFTEPDAPRESQGASSSDEDSAPEISPEVQRLLVGHDASTSTLAAMVAPRVQEAPALTESQQESSPPSPRNSVRVLAAKLLGSLPEATAQAVGTLMDAYEDGDAELRREVIVALGRMGNEKAIPVVVKGLQAEEQEIRSAALDALERFPGASDADQQLVALLADPDPHVRQRAVQVLGALKSPAALVHLPRALNDPDQQVCRTALRALCEEMKSSSLSERVVDLMLEFSGDLREEGAAALRRLGDFGAASRLVDILNDPDGEEYHWICIDALGVIFARESARQTESSKA